MENPEIQEIKEKATELEGSGKMMDPGSKVKPEKKRGRPKKEKKENPEIDQKAENPENPELNIPTKVIIGQAMPLISNAAVKYARHQDAAMKPEESDAMSSILAALIDKYAPNALSKYGLEITALVVCGQYGLRVYQIKKAVDAFENRMKPQVSPTAPVEPTAEVVQFVRPVEKENLDRNEFQPEH